MMRYLISLLLIYPLCSTAQIEKYVIDGKTYYGQPPAEAYTADNFSGEMITLDNIEVNNEDVNASGKRQSGYNSEWRKDINAIDRREYKSKKEERHYNGHILGREKHH